MSNWKQKYYNEVLTEEDFYPPQDDRVLKTNIRDSYYGEFEEYSEYIYDLYESEDYYEN